MHCPKKQEALTQGLEGMDTGRELPNWMNCHKGLGRIGKTHLGNITYKFPEAEVVAIADPLCIPGEKGMTDKYPLVTAEELIQHSDIEGVLICTPTETHAFLIELAAKAGKHDFCEKPQDLSLSRAMETLEILKPAVLNCAWFQ